MPIVPPNYPDQATEIIEIKNYRVAMAGLITKTRALRPSRELALAITKMQEVRHWLGEHLGTLAPGVDPYPQGNNPHHARIDPPRDTCATLQTILDPVCTLHGKKLSEHEGGRCLYCCFCFRELTPETCHVNAAGEKEDVCEACAASEKAEAAARTEMPFSQFSTCPLPKADNQNKNLQ